MTVSQIIFILLLVGFIVFVCIMEKSIKNDEREKKMKKGELKGEELMRYMRKKGKNKDYGKKWE